MLRDDHEPIAAFEPLLIGQTSPHLPGLQDLAFELTAKSAAFGASLPQPLTPALADLVRSMNCYYSNLIEGHNTHPVDIERALAEDYSSDPRQRDLQVEARAHIAAQKWIDEDGLTRMMLSATSPAAILEFHRRFCLELPSDLLWATDPFTGRTSQVVPGEFREQFVQMGGHTSISPGAVPRFLARMHEVYGQPGRSIAVLAAACAHHRLLWVHPFLDGNGRVARLMSYAMLRSALKTHGLWSVSRGLARQVDEYQRHLQACDAPRQGDLDGRGPLSETALAAFVRFFLSSCIDQVDFMAKLMRPDELERRVAIWTEEQIRASLLPPKSDIVLKAILYRGSIERGEIGPLVGLSERGARRITSALMSAGVIRSASTRAPLALAFPAKYADRWMPGLFPAPA
ncbi:MAG: Fic family protein [Pigmentiphaga sp.]